MSEGDSSRGPAQRVGAFLEGLADLLFVLAFLLGAHKLFFGVLVRRYAVGLFEVMEAWPVALRLLVGLPVIALPVGLAAYFLFGDREHPERGGLARLLELRDSPRLAPWLGLLRRSLAVLASFALLKLVWLTEDDGGWWSLAAELLRAF